MDLAAARPCVLGIDLGTGGPKAALVAVDGTILSSASASISTTFLPSGGAEQDPEEWWTTIVRVAREAIAAAGIAPEAVKGIGCTAQWSGTVATAEDSSPIRPAIIWMDSRGAGEMRRQAGGFPSVMGYGLAKIVRWVRLTGGAPGMSGKDPVAHILWFRSREPDLYRETAKFLEPVDWINMRLTGQARASYDSITLYWATDNRKLDLVHYDDKLLRIGGIERSKLPDLVETGAVMGHLAVRAATELGLPPGLPVVTGSGDVHSAAVGSGASTDFDLHLYIGTSSWISCHIPFKKTDPLHNIASIPAAVPGSYLVADEHETAGACLDFLATTMLAEDAGAQLADSRQAAPGGRSDPGSTGRVVTGGHLDPAVYEKLEETASAARPGSGGVIFTPWLNGERSPVDDHTVRGGFHNLSMSTTRDDIIRSVYEGVAYNSRWLLRAVESFIGHPCRRVVFIGGGARSRLWAQIHADVLQRPIVQATDPSMANVRGAGLLALLSLGLIRREDIPNLVPLKDPVEPNPQAEGIYMPLYREFLNIYTKTRRIYRRLNG